MSDRRWLDAARAPKRALDALARLAAASSPSVGGGFVLGELTGDPLRGLVAPSELPRPLEAALARLDVRPAEAPPERSPRGRAELLERPLPASRDTPRTASRDPAARRHAIAALADAAAVAMPIDVDTGAVAAAVRRALGEVAARGGVSSDAGPAAMFPAADAVRAMPPAASGLDAFTARIPGGGAAAGQPLAVARAEGASPGSARERSSGADVSGHRTLAAPSMPANAPTTTADLASARATLPASVSPSTSELAAAPTPAPPRNLAGLVDYFARRNTATAAPAADLVPVAGGPARRDGDGPATPPALGSVVARVADEPPRAGELVALDALTHAIERVLVSEVRRHGLVVEEP